MHNYPPLSIARYSDECRDHPFEYNHFGIRILTCVVLPAHYRHRQSDRQTDRQMNEGSCTVTTALISQLRQPGFEPLCAGVPGEFVAPVNSTV